MDRKPAVAGKFYPEEPAELKKEIEILFSKAKPQSCSNVRAIISPHAGYLFSGDVAASAFRQVGHGRDVSRVFVIGSSHRMAFDGASVYCEGDFLMPYGKEVVDVDFGKRLAGNNPNLFTADPSPHIHEHTIEVQLPFLRHVLVSGYKIVPIVVGTDDPEICKEISAVLKLHFNSRNLFVISTDFSHYPAYSDALQTDSKTKDAILSGNPSRLIEVLKENRIKKIKGLSTSLCGAGATLVLMNLTVENPDYEYREIEYKNSGDNDLYGQKDSVVGYWAIAICEKPQEKPFQISDSEKESLLRIAKESIEATVLNRGKNRIRVSDTSGTLSERCGLFVTLHKNGQLRGCIGRVESNIPLYKAVEEVAALSAHYDNRFPPVSPEELNHLEIEISVLSPPQKITDISQIKLGIHGIIIRKDNRSGVFLPQVATDTGWSLEEFLGYCARDKAGIGRDGWKSADIYIFTSTILQ